MEAVEQVLWDEARPASSSAMKGTVFQISARMMIATDGHFSVSGAFSPASQPRFWVRRSAREGRHDRDDRVGHQRRGAHQPAADDGAVHHDGEQHPKASSNAALTTVINIVMPKAFHQMGLESTVT